MSHIEFAFTRKTILYIVPYIRTNVRLDFVILVWRHPREWRCWETTRPW